MARPPQTPINKRLQEMEPEETQEPTTLIDVPVQELSVAARGSEIAAKKAEIGPNGEWIGPEDAIAYVGYPWLRRDHTTEQLYVSLPYEVEVIRYAEEYGCFAVRKPNTKVEVK